MKHNQPYRRHRFGVNKQKGQGMTEYVIIVALIAIAAITVVTMFGNTLRAQFAGISKELAGQNASEQITKASNYAESAWQDANTKKSGMAHYNNSMQD